jgi:hypothetical protein
MPTRKDIPKTLKRSPKKAQDTYAAAHDSAVKEYGEGERATAPRCRPSNTRPRRSATTGSPKVEKGPSDPKAAGGHGSKAKTAGGVDANASKEHLLSVAKRLDISGRTKMTKSDLVDAIRKANVKSTRKARAKGESAADDG